MRIPEIIGDAGKLYYEPFRPLCENNYGIANFSVTSVCLQYNNNTDNIDIFDSVFCKYPFNVPEEKSRKQ